MILPQYRGVFFSDAFLHEYSDFEIFDELFDNTIYFNPFYRYNVCYKNRRLYEGI